ncbi:MAG: DsbA family oxidoreductase [Betaproteobacteria bacterium]|nr:DsbA family oxidoreductase [Betaproteobacteria bacterium]MBA3775388.1 DsbA family oxidoreductase [Betaproteobacteria bacterium]
MAETVRVDVVSDVVCPWCFIGKRRLETALKALRGREPALDIAVRWHPFQLNPDLPREGISRRRYVETKFGGSERAAEIYARITAAGATVDVPFAFDLIARQPNTLDTHRLIAWAQETANEFGKKSGDADALVERLFRAYFLEGRFIGDRDELAALAADAGYNAVEARAFLESDARAEAVASADERARESGISGVPFFIFNGKTAVSGAQQPEVLRDAIVQARGGAQPPVSGDEASDRVVPWN